MICPHCHEESFAKKKNLTEGWKIVGQIEVCALCGKELKAASGKSAAKPDNSSRDRLAALLGGDFTEEVRLSGTAECNFCRNCRHFLIHPFKTVCALSDQEADPMGSCADFADREKTAEEDQ